MQLHSEAHDIEAALLQVANVATQFLIVHLGVLLHFLLEIGRCLRQFGEGSDVERVVVGDGGDVERAIPSLLVDPAIQIVGPVRALGVNAAGDCKRGAVELENGDIAELVAVGIEELVVVNVVVLAENPLAIGTQIGLRRLAFDLVVQRLLPFVGVGQIELVSEE